MLNIDLVNKINAECIYLNLVGMSLNKKKYLGYDWWLFPISFVSLVLILRYF